LMSSGAETSLTEVRCATKTVDACENNSFCVGGGFRDEQAYVGETCPIDIATNKKAEAERDNIETAFDMVET
jgi:hypothetical protein